MLWVIHRLSCVAAVNDNGNSIDGDAALSNLGGEYNLGLDLTFMHYVLKYLSLLLLCGFFMQFVNLELFLLVIANHFLYFLADVLDCLNRVKEDQYVSKYWIVGAFLPIVQYFSQSFNGSSFETFVVLSRSVEFINCVVLSFYFDHVAVIQVVFELLYVESG